MVVHGCRRTTPTSSYRYACRPTRERHGLYGTALTLTELPGYLTKRLLDVPAGLTYSQVEQTTIARTIAAPVSDVGVQLVTVPGAGFLRDRTYAYLEGPYRSDLLVNLSQVISGPEFRAEYAQPAGSPVCTLRIAYPRVGSGASGLYVCVLRVLKTGTRRRGTLTSCGRGRSLSATSPTPRRPAPRSR